MSNISFVQNKFFLVEETFFLTEEIKSKFILFLNNKFGHYNKINDFRFMTNHFYNEYSVNTFRELDYLLLSKANTFNDIKNTKNIKKVFICSVYKAITFIGKIYFLKKDGIWIISPDHS
jgi:hypothetical protein